MNQYARDAMNFWQLERPQDFKALQNPTEFFTQLGEQIEDQVIDLTDALIARQDQREPTSDYLTKVGRANAAKSQAIEVVMHEMVWATAPNREPSDT